MNQEVFLNIVRIPDFPNKPPKYKVTISITTKVRCLKVGFSGIKILPTRNLLQIAWTSSGSEESCAAPGPSFYQDYTMQDRRRTSHVDIGP